MRFQNKIFVYVTINYNKLYFENNLKTILSDFSDYSLVCQTFL